MDFLGDVFFIRLNLFIHHLFIFNGVHAAFGGFSGDEAIRFFISVCFKRHSRWLKPFIHTPVWFE